MDIYIIQYTYMFLKQANSDRENGIKQKFKMSPIKNHKQWKLEPEKDAF